jgi:hypothetical protein
MEWRMERPGDVRSEVDWLDARNIGVGLWLLVVSVSVGDWGLETVEEMYASVVRRGDGDGNMVSRWDWNVEDGRVETT